MKSLTASPVKQMRKHDYSCALYTYDYLVSNWLTQTNCL